MKQEFSYEPGHIKSSLRDLELFEEGSVWKDISSILNGMHVQVRDSLELAGIGTGVTPEEMPYTTGYYQGQAAMLRVVKTIVETMKKAKQEELEDGKDK